MRLSSILLALFFGLNIAPDTAHAGSTKPFTALAVQTAPNGASQDGRIFVSDQGTRYEFSEQGRDIVQIILPEQKIMRILFPKDKVYMETQAPADTAVAMAKTSSPCPPVDAITCDRVGMDKFGAIDVERWQQSIEGLQGTSTLWWDPKRKMIVRQEYPDGRIMQLQMTGEVDFNGRKAENWVISYAQPGQQVTTGLRLVDTDVGIIVKEQSPTGLVRELRDLKVVEVDPTWFTVPEGYQRIDPPQPAATQKQ